MSCVCSAAWKLLAINIRLGKTRIASRQPPFRATRHGILPARFLEEPLREEGLRVVNRF
jgi:hypothetical protein